MLRSPHAHADITAIDTAAARALPGVVAVFTAEDFEAVMDALSHVGVHHIDTPLTLEKIWHALQEQRA